MYEFDHIRQHHEDIVRWVQRERFAREIRDAQDDHGMVWRLRAVLIAVIHRMIG